MLSHSQVSSTSGGLCVCFFCGKIQASYICGNFQQIKSHTIAPEITRCEQKHFERHVFGAERAGLGYLMFTRFKIAMELSSSAVSHDSTIEMSLELYGRLFSDASVRTFLKTSTLYGRNRAVGMEVSRDVWTDVWRDIRTDISRCVRPDVSRDARTQVSRDVREDVSRVVRAYVSPDIRTDVSRGIRTDVSRDADVRASRKMSVRKSLGTSSSFTKRSLQRRWVPPELTTMKGLLGSRCHE